jgi:hypothetical protein
MGSRLNYQPSSNFAGAVTRHLNNQPFNHSIMSTTNTLTFVSSQTIAQFRAEKMIEKIVVKENPENNKVFITWIGGSGAVSKSYDTNKPKVISLVRDSEGVEFYMLHNESVSNEIETLV